MKIFRFWLPPILWAIAIFVFSSHESVRVSEVFFWNFTFFKTLHVIEYAILFTLVFRGILNTSHKTRSLAGKFSFGIASLYALSDEFHQHFIPTREATPRDVLIDVFGIIIAWYLICRYSPTLPRKLKSLAESYQLI